MDAVAQARLPVPTAAQSAFATACYDGTLVRAAERIARRERRNCKTKSGYWINRMLECGVPIRRYSACLYCFFGEWFDVRAISSALDRISGMTTRAFKCRHQL